MNDEIAPVILPDQNENNEQAVHAPVNAAAAVQPDNLWNPNDWDRVAEDLTWDRVCFKILFFRISNNFNF